MAEVEDELGMGSDGDGDFAREILGSIEGDKAIDTDIVIPRSGCKALGMQGDCLAGKRLVISWKTWISLLLFSGIR